VCTHTSRADPASITNIVSTGILAFIDTADAARGELALMAWPGPAARHRPHARIRAGRIFA
jgi:hypothetical protein